MQRVILSFVKWIFPLSIFWGFAFPLTKIITYSVSPMVISVVRIGVASIFFLILGKGLSIGVRQFVNGLLNFAFFLILLNVGITLSPNPGLVAVMIYTQPIFVLIIERILGSNINIKGTIGIVLGVIGVISSATLSFDIGLIFGLSAGILWAGGTVYYSRYLARENVAKLNAFMTLTSLPFVSAFIPFDYYFRFSLITLALLLLLAITAQILGFYFWFNGVREIGSIYASSGALLVPVMAYLFSFAVLGVVPTLPQIIGSIITLIGVYLTITSRGGPNKR
ncbi:DMT family transporter [Sulfolobus tengchongensis]|uniref:DMT family transporter n=1 Tax=Sulfolobus tengchongensis TaxID=207809 RepID=A0AAX4KYZ6_9CREN